MPTPPKEEPQIYIEVDEPYAAEVNVGDLARAMAATFAAEGQPDGAATLVVTSDAAVAELNQQYRGVAGPTDVLSFPTQETAPDPAAGSQVSFVSAPGMDAYLGDVVIALPFTHRQATELGRPLADELRLLAVHGALHLLGYDHAEPADETVMWARQDAILAGLARTADDGL